MRARDQEVHDALVRTIACRLPACTEGELRALDKVLVAVERERENGGELETLDIHIEREEPSN